MSAKFGHAVGLFLHHLIHSMFRYNHARFHKDVIHKPSTCRKAIHPKHELNILRFQKIAIKFFSRETTPGIVLAHRLFLHNLEHINTQLSIDPLQFMSSSSMTAMLILVLKKVSWIKFVYINTGQIIFDNFYKFKVSQNLRASFCVYIQELFCPQFVQGHEHVFNFSSLLLHKKLYITNIFGFLFLFYCICHVSYIQRIFPLQLCSF